MLQRNFNEKMTTKMHGHLMWQCVLPQALPHMFVICLCDAGSIIPPPLQIMADSHYKQSWWWLLLGRGTTQSIPVQLLNIHLTINVGMFGMLAFHKETGVRWMSPVYIACQTKLGETKKLASLRKRALSSCEKSHPIFERGTKQTKPLGMEETPMRFFLEQEVLI